MVFIQSLLICSLASLALADKLECPEGWHRYRNTCYGLRRTNVNQIQAEVGCEFDDNTLVTISTEGENNFVKELLRTTAADDVTGVWIGIKKRLSGKWNNLENYADWATSDSPQSPDLKCAIFSKDADWAWREADCREKMGREQLCERAPHQTVCFGGSCYDLHARALGLEYARRTCKMFGGYIVEINSEEEQNGVKDFLNRASLPRTRHGVWLGASAKNSESDFYWNYSGTEVGLGEFSDWALGEPHDEEEMDEYDSWERCTELHNLDWQWYDVKCRSLRAVLCERPEVSPISG